MIAENVLRLIEQYGLALVFLTILVLWLKPKMDEGWNILMSRLRTPDILIDNPHDLIEEMLDIDIDLNSLLMDARHEIDAAYVTVWQFHNGATSFCGVPFLKLSATHQQTRSGLVSWAQTYQGLPISLFIACNVFKEMIDSSSPVAVYIDQASGNETVVGIMEQHGAKTMICAPLKDSMNRFVGILTFSYMSKRNLEERYISVSLDFSTRVAMLLEVQARLKKGTNYGKKHVGQRSPG